MTEPRQVVAAFNDAITAGDLARLTALMTEDHRFVDAAGGTVEGRAACTEAWRGFFAAFPGYRNVLERLDVVGDEVVAHGRSECSVPELEGPATWHAVVRDGRVAEWWVRDPSS